MRVAARVRVRVCEGVRQERRLAWGVFLPSWKGTGRPSPVPGLSPGFLGFCFRRCDCTRKTRNPVSYKHGGVGGVVRVQPLARVEPTCSKRMPQCGPTNTDAVGVSTLAALRQQWAAVGRKCCMRLLSQEG